MILVVMPFVDLWNAYTLRAAEDVLQQTEECRLLLINNGSGDEDRRLAESWVGQHHPRVMLWSHDPQLPSLNWCWNAACEFAWRSGAEAAWIVNNDTRFHREMLACLKACLDGELRPLFVSGVGVRETDYEHADPECYNEGAWAQAIDYPHGGPDFSCFLISRECHQRFPFDSNLTYSGDNDYHRQLMLAGEGRRIFSVNLPYLHYASRTINRSPEALEAHHRVNAQHLAYYERKWGGRPNAERFTEPFKAESTADGVTNPELQNRGRLRAEPDGELDGQH